MSPSTFCACRIIRLTAPGRGAISSIAVHGEQASRLVDQCFRPARGGSLLDRSCGDILFGYWASEEGRGEEVVVCRRSDSEVEIHGHGGLAAPQAILDSLAEFGAVLEERQDWAERQFADPLVRAARLAIPRSLTTRTTAILLDQYRGAMGIRLRAIADLIKQRKWPEATAYLDRLLRFADLGQHLTRPWRVVLGGRPNVGKSCLLNAMLGYERAIVMGTPGTTRDAVTAMTSLDGWPVELVDTAGLRISDNDVESKGVELAYSEIASADLVLQIEVSDGLPENASSNSYEPWPTPRARQLRVRSKCDLLRNAEVEGLGELATSAVSGMGIDRLLDRIVMSLIPVLPEPGEPIAFEPYQVAAIQEARSALRHSNPQDALAAIERLLNG